MCVFNFESSGFEEYALSAYFMLYSMYRLSFDLTSGWFFIWYNGVDFNTLLVVETSLYTPSPKSLIQLKVGFAHWL